jgi:enoyl-CoA hydratase
MSVTVESIGAICVITVNRPERKNAIDPDTAGRLVEAFQHFDENAAHAVAIFTGAGGAFCAGADLKALSEGKHAPLSEVGDGPLGPTRMRLSKPVIAAVEGHAVAGGLELALWCDLRVAASDAIFGVYCRRFGVPLVDLGTIRLPRLIGHSRAMDLILTGRAVDAAEALHIGLVNRIAAPGQARQMAMELAEQIASFPQRCLRNDRLSALEQWDLSEADALRNEIRRGVDTLGSGETFDGARAFASGAGRHGKARSS